MEKKFHQINGNEKNQHYIFNKKGQQVIFNLHLNNSILIFLNQLSPEFVNDITKNGILITGGNSKIAGIEGYFKSKIGIKIIVPLDIYENFAKSSKKILSEKPMLKKIVNKN